ncbi:MAG: hypothetical protein E6Y23_05075, partial [Negativicoccus massiliensis]|nr:hypothetical protein [Negativicoccus massiliensis]MDU5027714.1 hypothetical protein [Negativicoccus succinicivorans]
FVLSQDQTLHDSLIAHLLPCCQGLFVIDSGLYTDPHIGVNSLHCSVFKEPRRFMRLDYNSISFSWCQVFSAPFFEIVRNALHQPNC